MDGTALPGPHPHESGDIRRNAGDVAKWNDPMDGFRDEAPADTGGAGTEPNEAQPQTQG